MTEIAKVYRGLRNGRGDKKVEVVEVARGVRTEPSSSGGIVVVPLEEDVAGTVRSLEHPSAEMGYDWPGSPGGEGAMRLAEALLRDAGEGAAGDRYATHAEEYAAEWVNELRLWSGPLIDEGALYLLREDRGLLESLWASGRRRNRGPSVMRRDRSVGPPRFALPAGATPEDVYEALTGRFYEDWRLYAYQVRRWAQERADVHAQARGVIEAGGGLVLIDLYGALARRLREMAVAAGREDDVVAVGAWPDSTAFNLLERPPGLSAEDLALLVAGAAETVCGWPEPESLDDPEEDLDEEEREEALAGLLLEDSVRTLVAANDALARRGDKEPAGRYTIFDARALIEPWSVDGRFFSELFCLLGDEAGSSGEELVASWERWRSLPQEVAEARARPVVSLLEELGEESWSSAFAALPAGPAAHRATLGGGENLVLVDLSGAGTPSRASELVGAVLVRLSGGGQQGSAAPVPVFFNGRHRHASFPLTWPGRAGAFALEARWNGADVRPC